MRLLLPRPFRAPGIVFVLIGGVLAFAAPQPTAAQFTDRPQMHQAPAQQGHQGRPPSASPAGGGVPSWAESGTPQPSYEQPSSTGRPRRNSAPGLPGSDPDNVPLGGAEWLAAAGAAYAIRRLSQSDASDA